MTTYTMSDDIVWTPRTIRRVAVEAVEVVAEVSGKAVKDVLREFSHLKIALMRVLDDFQDAKAAVIGKFLELEQLDKAPEWAT